MTSFEAPNSLFKITNDNKSFSFSMPGCWRNLHYLPEGIIDKVKDLLKLIPQKDIEVHVGKMKNEEF